MYPIDESTVVEDDVLGIVTEIQYRWPNLKIQYLDPERFADITDAPYRIIEQLPNGDINVVLQVWTLDRRVIDYLHQHNSHAVDIQAAIERENAKARKAQEAAKAEAFGERRDIIEHAFRSPKMTYTYDDPDTGEAKKFVDEGTGRVE